ncbi:unnamed protein product [Brassica rapa]|uniref:Uncharacterized protein n=1 Tax=Brassica campestris TaxID=3711 RepID=A0A8D9HP14_BRACM|nr:unnamed protein product [Brassica rapa]
MAFFSGAGEGVSRRRRDLPAHLCLLFVAMFFSYLLLCVSPFIKLLLCGGVKIRSSTRRRQIKRFIEPPLSASLALWLVFSSASSPEASSVAAVQCVSGKSPDVFFAGDCRTSLGVSASSVQISVRTPYSQRSPLFLSPGTDELFHPPFETPLLHPTPDPGNSSWLDLEEFRSFLSLSFPTMMMPAFSLLRSLVGRRQSSLGDSSFNGGGKFSLGYECILGLSADFGPHLPFFGAWPTKLMVKVSLFTSQLKNRVVVRDTIIVCTALNCLTRFVKIFGGFTDVYDLCALPYIYFMKKLLVGSPSHVSCSIPFPYLLSMKGEDFSVSTGKCSSFYTVLLSCVAVCTGPEDASETTSVYLVGENWVSTSLVTNFRLSDFVVKLLSTHSSFALNSLSSSHEDLSILALFAYVVYAFNQRGCLIPSGCTVVPKNIEV